MGLFLLTIATAVTLSRFVQETSSLSPFLHFRRHVQFNRQSINLHNSWISLPKICRSLPGTAVALHLDSLSRVVPEGVALVGNRSVGLRHPSPLIMNI